MSGAAAGDLPEEIGDGARRHAWQSYAEYYKYRIQDQWSFHDASAMRNQARFKTLRRVEIVAAASIPLVAAGGGLLRDYETLVAAALGVAVTIAAGMLSLNQYQERWVSARAIAERLKQLAFRFESGAAPYDDPNTAFATLVDDVESLLANQNQSWARSTRSIGSGPAPSAGESVADGEG